MALVKVEEENNKALALKRDETAFLPSRKRAKFVVLEEEKYVGAIEKIIERDFFPDLKKLRAQHEYLTALETNDETALRNIAKKYQTPLSHHIKSRDTPAAFETPLAGGGFGRNHPAAHTPMPNDSTSSVAEDGSTDPNAPPDEIETEADEMLKDANNYSLDAFMTKYTSEDNESFNEIIDATKERLRKKYNWLRERIEKHNEQLSLTDAQRDELKDNFRYLPLDTWKYEPLNALMYYPQGAALTPDEAVKFGLQKKIIKHDNTRFEKPPFLGTPGQPSTLGTNTSSAFDSDPSHIPRNPKLPFNAIDESSGSPRVNGYGFVVTPSPVPGKDAEVGVTWGFIEGTPFRLDASDVTPSSLGPSFQVQEASKRDRIAHKLAEEYKNKRLNSSGNNISNNNNNNRGQFKTPLPPSVNRGSTPRMVSDLSPAAQRLSEGLLAKSSFTKALRKNYASPLPVSSPFVKAQSRGGVNHHKTVGTPVSFKTPGTTPLQMPQGTLSSSSKSSVRQQSNAKPQNVSASSITDGLLY